MCARGPSFRVLGLTSDHIDYHVVARRWRLLTRDVVVLHRGPLTLAARSWAAVLGAPDGVAIAAWSALGSWGLRGWKRDRLHIVVARGQRADRHPWLVIHESRRAHTEDIVRGEGPPVHRVERAAVDAAAWQPSWRTAAGLMAAVVQQELTTPDRLLEQLDTVGSVRHRATMRRALADIAGGADSLAEIDFARLCRSAGLPEPFRQVRRRDASGRWRYLDVEWRMPGGRLVVEIDGIGHMERERWYDDLLRDAEIGTDRRTVRIRLPATAARHEPARVVAIVRRHLARLALAE